MAHAIDESTGKAAFAYTGQPGWHGLGQELTQGASLAKWRKEAGMDWTIEDVPVCYTLPDGKAAEFPNRRVFFRSDTKAPLSIVSGEFKKFHPGDCLEFYRKLVDAAGFTLETAGVLLGGKKFFALAKCGDNKRIIGNDEMAPYLLIASACDGSMATVADFTSVRVVCQNTLRMAVGDSGERARIRVPHSLKFDADDVHNRLGIITEVWGNFIDSAVKLAKFKIDRDVAIDLVAAQLKKEWRDKDGNDLTAEQKLDAGPTLRKIIALFDGEGQGSTYKSSKGTAWGLVNSVTEYVDHHTSGARGRVFDMANFGSFAKLKTDVANELLLLAA